ncbi:hypothetical protein AXE80_00140 [Wenyingzhuangia fucanilytica]|uniref:Secretion system C-terminal sorting domain-containing protein n=1 Tax=Wenyingzhuangia fucanilytica TaxID=1790137 RepID=A0A1B1Y201_9FLAO|nr:T9SS type A sorting domain-containing protein [Wenyingzhuangia fucanilytica]ANW94796.1 hypothetical protein AXE80_00140 [Wenyingzhuangia fucanilytica]
MRKRAFYLFLSVIVFAGITVLVYDYNHVSRAEYAKMIAEYSNNKEADGLFNRDGEAEGEGELPPDKYFKRQYLLEMNPRTGKTHPENIEKLKKQQKSQVKFFKVPGESNEMAWLERGPDNIGGRTRVLFFDPNDVTAKRVFAGGVSGGLWVNNDITDENSLWTQVGIDENLSVSCYAIDPNNSNIWYVGTGESYTSNTGTGNGLWRTTNGGATWNQLTSVDFNQDETGRHYFINKIIARNNQGTTELYIAMDGAYDYDFVGHGLSGWWKYTNDVLNQVIFNTSNNTPYVFSDVEIAADNSMWFATKNNVYGHGGGKIFRSVDGSNFVEKYSFNTGDRVELSVSKQDANVVYALAEVAGGVELVKTVNASNFVAIAKPNDADTDIDANDFTRGQAFYDLVIEVDPNDDDIVYAGGINLFRSSNAGASWTQISKWSNNNNLSNLNVSKVHADQHVMSYSPLSSNVAVFGNDGGVYYGTNLSGSGNSTIAIAGRNKNYNVTQFYSAAIGQDKNNETFLGGAQDNGSLFVSGAGMGINSFSDLYGGDGAQAFIDKDGDYAVISYVHNTYATQPLPFVSLSQQIEIENDQHSGAFINIADLDHNLDILFTDGTTGYGTNNVTEKISRFKNLTTVPVRQNFTNPLLFEPPTAIKVSPFTTSSSTVFIGTETGTMLKVTAFNTDNPVWTKIDVSNEINTGAVSDISFGSNENEIVVTLHNYGVNNIYYTVDGGANWSVKDGDLPDIPTKTILINPLDKDEVIVGTNFGVWKTANFTSENPNWVQSQNGMSSVKVTQLELRTADNTVIASTYGRGFFTGKFVSNELSTPKNTVTTRDFEINAVVDNKTIEIKKLSSVNETVNVSVYNASGVLMLAKALDFRLENSHSLDVSLQPGVYIVNLTYGNKRMTKKVIVVN